MGAHSIAIANVVEASEFISNETPSGDVDSVNDTFTLDNIPIPSTLNVYLNGLFQLQGSGDDYTISGNTVVFVKPPRTGSIIIVTYIFNS